MPGKLGKFFNKILGKNIDHLQNKFYFQTQCVKVTLSLNYYLASRVSEKYSVDKPNYLENLSSTITCLKSRISK